MKNLFDLNGIHSPENEVFEILFNGNNLRIERIVTIKPFETPGEWYDQDQDEWVALLRGNAVLEFQSGELLPMIPGDWVLIPAHRIHRVRHTGSEINSVWLAIHGNLK
jgi:cupin 2 domain-containing protein